MAFSVNRVSHVHIWTLWSAVPYPHMDVMECGAEACQNGLRDVYKLGLKPPVWDGGQKCVIKSLDPYNPSPRKYFDFYYYMADQDLLNCLENLNSARARKIENRNINLCKLDVTTVWYILYNLVLPEGFQNESR